MCFTTLFYIVSWRDERFGLPMDCFRGHVLLELQAPLTSKHKQTHFTYEVSAYSIFCSSIRTPGPWGPSINDIASLEGGRGGQTDDMGRYEGVRVKENPILSIQDQQIIIFS